MKRLLILVLLVIVVVTIVVLRTTSEVSCLHVSIGIKTLNGDFTELIPAGTRLPHMFSDRFANAQDNQTSIEMQISQKIGDRILIIDTLVVDGLPPRESGTLILELRLKVDRKKRLWITAVSEDGYFMREYGPYKIDE